MPQRGSRSFFKDINRVETAHVVTATRDGLSSRCHRQPQWLPGRLQSDNYIEGLRHHLDQATQSRLRGINGVVGAQLSAGFDSGAVTATAAKLLAPNGGKVIAFTAVPRQNYDGPAPRNQFNDEGPLAAATAAKYPNIEHILVRSGPLSPLEDLDRNFFLYDRPMPNLANAAWAQAISQAARKRKINILLTGQFGNMTLSYTGLELLPELLSQGRLIELFREAAKLVEKTNTRCAARQRRFLARSYRIGYGIGRMMPLRATNMTS